MSAINICRVITRLPVGGIERRLAAILPRLNQEPFAVRVACLHERGELADEIAAAGVPVDLVKLPSRLSPSGIRALAGYFREHEINIVHSHMYRANVPATLAARLAKTPVVLSQVHNVDTWETLRQRWLDRLLCHFRSGMIAVSQRVRDDVCRNLGCPPEFVHLLYNGVDIARFRDAPVDLALKQELHVAPDERLAVCVARLHPQKNHALLFHALKQLGRRAEKLITVVIGSGVEGENLRQLAKQLGIDSRVLFTGRRHDVEKYFKLADFSILPSLKEGFSNTVIESMAAGCPVIATDVGGNREAIVNGETGLIVPSEDCDALAAAIEKLLADAPLRRRMRDASPQRAEVFSLDAMLDATRNLYRKLYQPSASDW